MSASVCVSSILSVLRTTPSSASGSVSLTCFFEPCYLQLYTFISLFVTPGTGFNTTSDDQVKMAETALPGFSSRPQHFWMFVTSTVKNHRRGDFGFKTCSMFVTARLKPPQHTIMKNCSLQITTGKLRIVNPFTGTKYETLNFHKPDKSYFTFVIRIFC